MANQACLGYLWMKGKEGDAGRDLQDWTCSLCLLRSGKIIHFDIEPTTMPKGKIPLPDAEAEVSTGAVPGALYSAADCFRVKTSNRIFHIFAETHENRNKWVNLLTEHIQKLQAEPDIFQRSNKDNFELKEQIATAERVEFLTKSGGIKNLSWKKRLFVLNGENLVYYELPQGLRARGNYGVFSVKAATEVVDLPQNMTSETIMRVDTDSGTLLLGAMDEEDKIRWMDALMSRSSTEPNIPSPSAGATAPTPGDYGNSVQKLTDEKEQLNLKLREMTDMKEKSDKIIRALKNENKKLKQSVEDLTVQLREKDQGISHLTATMERMRIEVMEAHDSQSNLLRK